jgi:outer membrane protein OmpA-like peptidoglycan-associated protein
VVAVLLVAVIVLVTGFAVGLGIHKSRGGAPTTQAAAPAAAPAMAAASSDDASVVVENGVVKFYFASGKADLAAGALVALGDAIAAAKAGKRLVLSGFHDATGDPAFNAELAKKRALAVRDALVGAGVAETSLELKKPEQTTGTGNDAEARRVEVMIAG